VQKLLGPYAKDWAAPDALKMVREQDPAELTRDDQIYLYTAYELHHYWKARMRALAMTRNFEAEYDEITAKLKQVVDISEALRDSVRLMPIFGLILDIGNFMNDSNKQAMGFKLTSLARLGMVKDLNNECTLLDYVERVVRHQYPQWEGFVDDIAGVTTAQKINIEQLQNDAKKYIDNIKNVQASLDAGNLSDPTKFHPEDRVSQVVQRSMKDARRSADQMAARLEAMNTSYDAILAFFGDDNRDENARREFFGKLANFLSEYKKSHEKNLQLEEQWQRNENNMRRKQALKAQTSAQALSAGDAPPSPGTGAMDALMEKLRAAAPQTRDTRDRRRRARLKDRHNVRVASGQQIPETGENVDENGMLTPAKSNESDAGSAEGGGVSEGEDIADRAASLLQGLRGDEEGEAGDRDSKHDSLRVRRRRESANDERAQRRARRRGAGTSTDAATQSTITEENGATETAADEDEANRDSGENQLPTPTTIVVPPSPVVSEFRVEAEE